MSAKDYDRGESKDVHRDEWGASTTSTSFEADAKSLPSSSGGASSSREDDKAGSKMTEDDLLNAVQEYFYGDQELGETFEGFVNKNAGVVDLDGIEHNEYKLEYTELYMQYKGLFERKLEGYIEQQLQTSIHIFYDALKKKIDEDPEGNAAIFGQILLAVSDFDIFMTMMKEAAYSQRKK